MAYEKTEWQNGTGEPINADNLNKIEQGIEDAHTDISEINSKIENVVDKNVLETNYLAKGDIKVITLEEALVVPQSGQQYRDSNYNISSMVGEGYTPIGVVGTRIKNSQGGGNAANVVVAWAYVSGTTLYVRLRSIASNVSSIVDARYYILCKK